MRLLYTDDPSLVCFCSDIFVRLISIRLFDKNAKVMTDGFAFLMTLFAQETVSLPELEVIVPIVFWCVDSKPPAVADYALDLLFVAKTHSDPMDYSCVLRSCLETCSVVSLVHLFSELQFAIVADPRNPSIFTELMPFLEHRSVEVVASCGGALALLWRRMPDADRTAIMDSLSDQQRDALGSVLPLEARAGLDFETFGRMNALEKVRVCRRLIEQLRVAAPAVQSSADAVLTALLRELSTQETDWGAMKPVVFALHGLLLHCTFQPPDLQRTLLAVVFFANRWQRKLVLLDGLFQTVNAILWRLFEKTPLPLVFTTLLEGMGKFKGGVPADSFYCKCWVAVSGQITELMQPGDAAKLLQIATDQQQECAGDVRGKLCQALALTLNGKKPEHKEQKSPVKKVPSPTKEVVTVPSRVEARTVTKKKAVVSEQVSPRVVPAARATEDVEAVQSKRPSETNQVAELKTRLQLLRQRWTSDADRKN
jgi:hypothetical protein